MSESTLPEAIEGHVRPAKGHWILLGACAIAAAFAFQGSRGLYETTEGRYALVAQEMLRSGNYLEPTLAGRPHWSKPPLTYWTIGAGMALLGENEWGARMANAVAFVLTVFIVAACGSTLWDRTTGVVAGLIYAACPFAVFGAYSLTTDTLLTFFETAMVLCYLRATYPQVKPSSKLWITGMWCAFGAAFLTKGTPSLLIFGAILLWHATRRVPLRLFQVPGLLLFLAVGGGWYIVVVGEHHNLLRYFLGHEVADRVFSGSGGHNHQWYKPFVIYLPLLTAGPLPWSAVLLWRAVAARKEARSTCCGLLTGRGPASFLFLWTAVPLFAFSLIPSRLPLYVLPLAAPILLACSRAICRTFADAALRKSCQASLCMCLLLVAAKGISASLPSKKDMRRLYELCLAEGGPKAVLASVNRSKLYGLQFYHRGRFLRLSSPQKARWADASLSEVLDRTKPSRLSCPWIFLSGAHTAASLFRTLCERGFTVRLRRWTMWGICAVRPGPIPRESTQPHS